MGLQSIIRKNVLLLWFRLREQVLPKVNFTEMLSYLFPLNHFEQKCIRTHFGEQDLCFGVAKKCDEVSLFAFSLMTSSSLPELSCSNIECSYSRWNIMVCYLLFFQLMFFVRKEKRILISLPSAFFLFLSDWLLRGFHIKVILHNINNCL